MLKKFIFILFCCLFFCSCKIARSGKTVSSSSSATTILAFFRSMQVDIEANVAPENRVFSQFTGRVFTADRPEANFDKWVRPLGTYRYSCNYSVSDGINFNIQKVVDVGNLSIEGKSFQKALNKGQPVPYFASADYLASGAYTLRIEGFKGALGFDQSFSVPDTGSAWKLSSADNLDQPLDTKNDHIVKIVKANGALIHYVPPAGIDYTKIFLSDGTSSAGGALICYVGPSETELNLPPIAFQYFQNGTAGSLYIDFVRASEKLDIPGIKQSLILTSMRHIHGGVDVPSGSNSSSRINLGQIAFE